jgi:hypothetical protein
LLKTIDGDPVTARWLIGRNEVSGTDEAATPEAVRAIAEALGATFEAVPKRDIGGDAGRITGGLYSPVIKTDKNLPLNKQRTVEAHEVGHIIDEIAKQINGKGLSEELQGLYKIQNNPFYREGQPKKQWAKPGYDAAREYMAEAVRAYLQNPNYIKTAAPAVAKRIREAVNNNPRLKDIIQFNALAGVGVLSAGALAPQEKTLKAP